MIRLFLALIGAGFILATFWAVPVMLKDNDPKAKEAVWQAVRALWVMVGVLSVFGLLCAINYLIRGYFD